MNTMLKKEINLSINAHVELVTRMVLDAYEINKHRAEKSRDRTAILYPGNMVYHRILRQTGHTAALKRLLSDKFQAEHGVRTLGIFHTTQEMKANLMTSRNIHTGETYEVPEIPVSSRATIRVNLDGEIGLQDTNILIFSDTLHDDRRLKDAHQFVSETIPQLPNLMLVVFLG